MKICNAPATFQRAMNMTFQNFVNKTRLTQGTINFCVIVYMDDILVYSETYHGHAQHIEWTLGALRDFGFKITLEKSESFLPEMSFQGYVVTRGGLRPDSRKVSAVKDAPVPTSLTQVRAFLGLALYYRDFIKGFAAIARPLPNLLRKDQPLSWDVECEQASATLKDALAPTPILIRPDPTKQFILITEWQPEAISAILAQKGNDDREHVIEYASRMVPDERRNDSAPQGECYAVVWGIQHFHPYLYEHKFLLVTYHEPLLTLKRLTNYTGMIGRWAVRLQEYDFDIVHQKMERHKNADGLTRLHRPANLKEKWNDWWEAYAELAFCLLKVGFRYSEPTPYGEGPELLDDVVEILILQAWRTATEGDLLGILFGKVDDGNLALVTSELLVFLTQLVDDLPLDIVSWCDNQSGTHVLSRMLEPRLLWSTCNELDDDNCIYPSQALFLEINVTDLTLWDPIVWRGGARQEEEESEDDEEEESSEDRYDSDYIQGEEEEDEEGEPAEEEAVAGELSQRLGQSKEKEEAKARKRLEKAEGKRPITEGPPPDLSLANPWLDPKTPKEEEGGDGAAAEGSGRRRRRRSESPTSSGSPSRPALRLRQDEGDRASSLVILSSPPLLLDAHLTPK
ncbi:hypothetical protein CBR_g32647 [Chara braunii]|uniref:Reverse transcriptase domain-containing protein n=1 Tax=Chara braunii TaxID=69332 RepID=A0A388LHF0_CHABU|nr:hypothetical protein CBR_g32647 [Chara braunii]|eukprot:GBG81653.1 hypothetical protein CBR_g32647 [Chara braunii]